MTLAGKRQFDQLRVRLSALEARTRELIAEQFDRVRAAQQLTNIVQGAAALLLLAGVIICDWLLRRMLMRPVASVLQDVTAVAGGDYDRTIRTPVCVRSPCWPIRLKPCATLFAAKPPR